MVQSRRNGASPEWKSGLYWPSSSLMVEDPPGTGTENQATSWVCAGLTGWGATVCFPPLPTAVSAVGLAVWLQGEKSHSCEFFFCSEILPLSAGFSPLLSSLQSLALAADLAFIRQVQILQFAFHCFDNGCDLPMAASHYIPIYGSSLIRRWG